MTTNRLSHFLPARTLLAVAFLAATSNLTYADGSPVFHLDFSTFADQSGSALTIEVGEAVSLVAGGGPTLEGGATLDAGNWDGVEDETNQIIIEDHPILDAVTVGPGSIVTWINPEDGDEWNNIAKTPCEDNLEPCDAFGQFNGIEFQASGPHAGVFGAVQGWDTNVFGPDTPLGEGGETDTPSGEWTHAALTWNADGDHTIYVNGVAGDVVEGVGDDFEFGDNLTDYWTIGGDGLGTHPENVDSTRYLAGRLADFAIYDGELSASEIAEIMRAGVVSSSEPGDFDGNGTLDLADVNLLSAAIATGANDGQFDLTGDASVTVADLGVWIKDLQNSWIGDANLDGEFNSGDLVSVFTAGKFEQEQDAGWDEGDWNGDSRFNSGDFVVAFADGGFEQGPRAATAAVPEPSSLSLIALGLVALVCRGRRA